MFRPEPHVAQHIRREKLRVHDPSSFPPQLDFSGAESSSSFLNPFEPAPVGAACGGTIWNASLLPSADVHLPSFPFSPYSLHEDMAPLLAPPPPPDGGSELLLLPSYVTNPPSVWTTRSRGESQGALALSLASNPPSGQFASCGDRWLPIQGIGGARPTAGPLGPFTGYAAILKGSKFLKPAQQLLDEFCHAVTGSRAGRLYDTGSSGAASSSSLQSSSEPAGVEACGGHGRGGKLHQRPEFEHMKTKLLYMQEEAYAIEALVRAKFRTQMRASGVFRQVCKRYKQYHQQMQMVVSSFETVAGLSSATPYTTLALKAVSKHFRCLKSAISDQLRHVCNVLGEELMASSPTSCKNDSLAFPKQKYVDPNLRRQKCNDGSLGFSDNSHPVWRPQRGLPERAVSVLRAWLFDHFLHPYPTDTDKHMLATQTGLSRNQVSNWFINARVRLWKPMVEEIHSLETKGMAGMDLNSSIKSLDKSAIDQRSDGQLSKPAEGSESGELIIEKSARCAEPWHPDKRSRMEECAMDAAGLMSFAYQGAMDIGGLGAVSLTLGLRQGEGLQQHQQRQEEEQQLRRFGHQMLHDFVG